MCEFHDPAVPKQCTEDDAEEVIEKAEKLGFDTGLTDVFDARQATEASRAKSDLAELFGEEEKQKPDDNALLEDAEDLFK